MEDGCLQNIPVSIPNVGNVRRRSSVAQHAQEVAHMAQSISQMTIDGGKMAVNQVGSFLGLTTHDDAIKIWKEKFLKRVESGDIGFTVHGMMPHFTPAHKQLDKLEKTLTQARAMRQRTQHALDELVSSCRSQSLSSASQRAAVCHNQPGAVTQLLSNTKECSFVTSDSAVTSRNVTPTYQELSNIPSLVYKQADDGQKSATRERIRRPKSGPASIESWVFSEEKLNASPPKGFKPANNKAVAHQQPDITSQRSRSLRRSLDLSRLSNDKSPSRTGVDSRESLEEYFMKRRGSPSSLALMGSPRECGSMRRFSEERISAASRRTSITFSPEVKMSSTGSSTKPHRASIAMRLNLGSQDQITSPTKSILKPMTFEAEERKRQIARRKHSLENDIRMEQELISMTLRKLHEYRSQISSQSCWQRVMNCFNCIGCLSRDGSTNQSTKCCGRTARDSPTSGVGTSETEGSQVNSSDFQATDDTGVCVENEALEKSRGQQDYKPWFIVSISVVQVLCMLVLLCLGGISSIGLEPELMLSTTNTFKGMETKEHWHIHNVWIGPDLFFLIRMGALFAPCMRHDKVIYEGYAHVFTNASARLGCCEMSAFDTAGTTTEHECFTATQGVGYWRSGVGCSSRPLNESSVSHVIKPCCNGVRGHCNMTSSEHCELLEGMFIDGPESPEHCSQVNCLSYTCGMGGFEPDPEFTYLPLNPNQWWRVAISIFYHQGILQLALILVLQLALGIPTEKTAGWLRMALIYLISATMGQMVGAIMSPFIPHVGAEGAVAGILAVSLVELAQSRTLLKHPQQKLIILLLISCMLLLSGTLPFVDNFTLLAGFVFGLVTGIIVLPYITFAHWHTMWRRGLVCISTPCLIMLVGMVFYGFYDIQKMREKCGWVCEMFNCIPYTPNMCLLESLW